jgi:hypothetical protein
MRLGIGEILKQVSESKTKEEKLEILRKHDSATIRTILKYALDPNIKWDLPAGNPPYKPCQFLDQQSMLYQETRRLYLFLEGGNINLKPIKREALFINLLESVHPLDAEVLLAAKDKKLPYKNITTNIINEAYPGLI